MALTDNAYFSVLRAQLSQLGARQKAIAENIANAATPDYTPHDVDMKAFQRMADDAAGVGGRLAMARTQAGHFPVAVHAAGAHKLVAAPDSETTIDGNSVVLEDQMLRSSETRQRFELSLSLYQKGLQMMRMAAKPPGR